MRENDQTRNSNRRTLLKGIGLSAVGLPAAGNVGATGESIGSLRVSNVEIGWADLDGDWRSAGGHIDSDEAVDVRVEVSGLSGDSEFVSVVVPGGPNGELLHPDVERIDNLSASGRFSYTHGGGVTNAFSPDPLFGSWPEGTWRFYVSAFENDGDENAHGIGVSGDVLID